MSPQDKINDTWERTIRIETTVNDLAKREDGRDKRIARVEKQIWVGAGIVACLVALKERIFGS